MVEEVCRTLILSAMGIFAFLQGMDVIIFMFRPAPKISIFSKISHIIGFIFAVILTTIYLV